MRQKNADGIANSVDPDQTAPPGAIWSGSIRFAQTYPSEDLGSLQYVSKVYMLGQNQSTPRKHLGIYYTWKETTVNQKIY